MRVWKGQINFSIENYIAQHRNDYASMQQCADHVAFQLPNEHTRVLYLLGGIQCNDAPLQAAMDIVRYDAIPGRNMNEFEATASYLIPHDPVPKKQSAGNKIGVAEISNTYGAEASLTSSIKPATGNTGAQFCFYDHSDYQTLTYDQKDELREYRKGRSTKEGDRGVKKHQGISKWYQSTKKFISAAVTKKLKDKLNQEKDTSDNDEKNWSYIMSIRSDATGNTSQEKTSSPMMASTSRPTAKKVTLNGIL